MEEKNKKMLMIGGLVALAAGVYWYMKKNSEPIRGFPSSLDNNNSVPETPITDVSSTISSANEVNNERIEYIETTWSLNQNEAREIIQYVDNNIKPTPDWMESTREKANNKGRSVEQQLIHEAVWMLYKRDNAKYKGKL